MTYKLLNVQLEHKKYPKVYEVPTKKQISGVKVGDNIKLCFELIKPEGNICAERMWVEVVQVNKNSFVGTLNNDPLVITDIKYLDLIEFESKHIMSIY